MNIFKYFKEKGIDTVEPSFYRMIEIWDSWYISNVSKFHRYRMYTGIGTWKNCKRHSLGMAKKVSEDIANELLNERVKITISDERTNEYVNDVLNKNQFYIKGNEYQERKAAKGTVAYVPYVTNAVMYDDGTITGGEVKINYLEARNIYPVTWENGKVLECVFVYPKTYLGKKYAQIQFHKLENGLYVIENDVVECTNGAGTTITKEKWKDIPLFASLSDRIETGSDRPQFVIDRLNIVNNINSTDDNPMGVSIFANAIDVLRKIDLEYDSYANEFGLGKKRLFVDPEITRFRDGSPVFDPDDTVFYQLPDGYFGKTNEAMHEVNMALRVNEHSTAINDDLNYLSMKCGFGTQKYKFESGNVKTATEIISENSEEYRTISKHEIILEDVLKELVRIIARLGLVTGAQVNPDAEIAIDFDDSIIEDKSAERRQDMSDMAAGVMTKVEYRMKWYGETEEEAAKHIIDDTAVIE